MMALAIILNLKALLFCSVNARLMYMELDAVNPAHLSRQLDNHHIVMAGDSLMRYQYLTLVYLIHTNTFYPNERVPNIALEKTYKSWHDFYTISNNLFNPNEYCDCFRAQELNLPRIYENRYYYHPERNISISYIQYFGDKYPFHGHWQPLENETNHHQHPPDPTFLPYNWEYDRVEEAIENIAAKLVPKPSILLLNAGHWANNWDKQSHRDEVLGRILPLFDRIIWKTTNYANTQVPSPEARDADCFKDTRMECMDQEWTKYLIKSNYWDGYHYLPPIYEDVNIQFINQIINKTAIYPVPMAAKHHGDIMVCKGKHFFVDDSGIMRPFDTPGAALRGESTEACVAYIAQRTHHVHENVLVKHLLGEKISSICEFKQ